MTSTTQYAPATMKPTTRWLLLASLALNLFFIGVTIAMAVRPHHPPRGWDRDVFVRTERLAENLPKADGDLLIAQMKANREPIEKAQKQYRGAQERIREAYRKEPYDPNLLRTAMNETRAARQEFDAALQSAFANAAGQMSQPGRTALGNARPGTPERQPKR